MLSMTDRASATERLVQLTMNSKGHATEVIKEHAFDELIKYVESNRGSGDVLCTDV